MRKISSSFRARLSSTRQLKKQRVKTMNWNEKLRIWSPSRLIDRIILPLARSMKDSHKCSLTQQKTNRLSNQRGIPRSENPKHKTLISWLNPKYTCRDAICFAARGVSIQPRLQIITMTEKDCWNREHLTRLCRVHPISPRHHFMPTLSRRHERDCDQISSNILGVLQ